MRKSKKAMMLTGIFLGVTACAGMGSSAQEASEEITLDVWCWDDSFNGYAMKKAA